MNNWFYGYLPAYKSNFAKITERVKQSDVLVTDGTHRIVGLMWDKNWDKSPIISLICIRSEVAFAKKVAFENNIKIITAVKLSASLFHKYTAGECIEEEHYRPVAKIYAKLPQFRRSRKV